MAVQTKQFFRSSAHGVVVLQIWEEYEDTDYRIESNDDGENDDFRVIRWFGTNFSATDLRIQVKRGNGQHWQDRVIPAGESFSQNAGGAVKYEFDVPEWRYG